jgi:hypothetical protein
MSAGVHDDGGEILLGVHGATSHPMSAEHLRPPGHGGHGCGTDVYAEQRTAALQMALESPLSGIDASLGSGLARVSDVDDDHVWLARFGQNLLYFFTDRHLVTEPSNDVGQPL